MATLVKLNRVSIKRFLNFGNKRLVSTSSKKNDTAVVADACKAESKVNRNWVTYGFSRVDKDEDRFWTHVSFFGSVTMCLIFGGAYYAYMPDLSLRDWAQREAFLELRRRERSGLPLVDPNLVDVNRIELPSDEDLGNTEIII